MNTRLKTLLRRIRGSLGSASAAGSLALARAGGEGEYELPAPTGGAATPARAARERDGRGPEVSLP